MISKQFKEFKIGDLFSVKRGKRIVRNVDYLIERTDEYIFPVITSTTKNNGVDGFYHSTNCKGNSLVCGGEASGMFTTYQSEECWVMDRARIFKPKDGVKMNKNIGLYLATVFNLNQYRYSYGRSANPSEIERLTILLPEKNGIPDYTYMENYIDNLHSKELKSINMSNKSSLNVDGWSEFKLEDIFEIKKGKRLTKLDMIPGDVNFVAAISDNNGIRQAIDANPEYINNGNCITVNYNGSVGEAFYQKDQFWASDDVNILYSKNWEMNKYNALFICTIIKQNKYRFGYGRKWTLDKMKKSIINLPIDSLGNPDFTLMEEYIKKLPFGDKI